MMSWDAVVFDFDGVLTDSEPLHYETFQRVLAPRGMAFSWEDYCRDYMGFDDRDVFDRCFSINGKGADRRVLDACIREKAALFAAVAEERDVQPFPGAVAFIQDLSEAGIPLALCSGALRSDVTPILRKFGVLERFAVISTAEDVSRSKPSPEPYRHALSSLCRVSGRDFPPSRCVAFEDTREGMMSAAEAGLRVIAVLHRHQKVDFSSRLYTLCSFEGCSADWLKALAPHSETIQ